MQTCANRIERIYEREMAEKHEKLMALFRNHNETVKELVTKMERILLLERALKPVIECNTNDIILTSDESACARGFDECMNAVEAIENAQRIILEAWDDKNYFWKVENND